MVIPGRRLESPQNIDDIGQVGCGNEPFVKGDVFERGIVHLLIPFVKMREVLT